MSIQSQVNNALSVGAALLSQTPMAEAAKENREYRKAEKEFKERKKVFNQLTNDVDIGQPGDPMTEEQLALFKEGDTPETKDQGRLRSLALDTANEGYVAAAEKLARIKPTSENFERLAERRAHGETRHKRREELMAEANRRAKERVVAQNAQNQASAERYVWARNFVAGE